MVALRAGPIMSRVKVQADTLLHLLLTCRWTPPVSLMGLLVPVPVCRLASAVHRPPPLPSVVIILARPTVVSVLGTLVPLRLISKFLTVVALRKPVRCVVLTQGPMGRHSPLVVACRVVSGSPATRATAEATKTKRLLSLPLRVDTRVALLSVEDRPMVLANRVKLAVKVA